MKSDSSIVRDRNSRILVAIAAGLIKILVITVVIYLFAKEILTGGLSNSAFFLSIVIASGITFVAGYANLGRFLVSNDGNKASVCSDPFRHNEAQYVSYGPGYHARFPWEKEMGVFSLAPLTSNVEQSVNTMSGKAFIKAVVQWEVDLGAVDVHRI